MLPMKWRIRILRVLALVVAVPISLFLSGAAERFALRHNFETPGELIWRALPARLTWHPEEYLSGFLPILAIDSLLSLIPIMLLLWAAYTVIRALRVRLKDSG
jgi:hypothetical protein